LPPTVCRPAADREQNACACDELFDWTLPPLTLHEALRRRVVINEYTGRSGSSVSVMLNWRALLPD